MNKMHFINLDLSLFNDLDLSTTIESLNNYYITFNKEAFSLGMRFGDSDYSIIQDIYYWNYEIIITGLSPVIILFMLGFTGVETTSETSVEQKTEHKQEEEPELQKVELAVELPPKTRRKADIIQWGIVYEKDNPASGSLIRMACVGNKNYMLTSIEEPGVRGVRTVGMIEYGSFKGMGHIIPFIQAPPGIQFTSNGKPVTITNDDRMFIFQAPSSK